MAVSAPEFSRLVRIDTIGERPRSEAIAANEAERAALARRFGLQGIGRLAAEAEVRRKEEEVRAMGRIEAEIVQTCVATGEPVPGRIEESFELVFRPQPKAGAADEEIELGEADLDTIFYRGGAVDLGEAVAETLGLALDPFPRAPDAAQALREAGVMSEEEAQAESSPFAALKDEFGGA